MNTPTFIKNLSKTAFIASALFFASCTEDNTILEDIGIGNDGTVTVSATNTAGDSETQYSTTATAGSTVTVSVNFSVEEAERNMERLYITKTDFSSLDGPQPYDITLDGTIEGISTKSDGSIDLDDDHKEAFSFSIDFPAPTEADGTVQYVIWATKQRGDFRDLTNDNVYGDDTANYAVITIGEGVSSVYSEFSTTILAAPLADGTSHTFASAYNGATYAINDGIETAALWDFGYFYGASTEASFYSAADFPKVFTVDGVDGVVDVATFLDSDEVSTSDLNNCYFALSTLTADEFDAIDSNEDLDTISTPTDENVKGLSVGDVVEFVDQYGNKGLIKVTALTNGFGSDGKITFDIKVQASAIAL